MYAAIWRVLPGPVWLKVLLALVLVAAVLTALVLWVFPAVDRLVEPSEVTVDNALLRR